MWRVFSRPVSLVLLFAAVVACTGEERTDEPGSGVSDEVQVFAAASLTDAFQELGTAFEGAQPGVDVAFNFAGSSSLAVQIVQGAPADVFASANMAQMEQVQDEGLAADASVFATNALTVVTARETASVVAFEDLAEPGVRLVLAAPEVPAGAFAREMLERAASLPDIDDNFDEQVLANVVSNETSVRAVLTKVELGEADAGIVYVTDARVAGDSVDTIPVPDEANVVASYPVAVLNDAANPAGAQAFVDFVLSDAGQTILAEHGFGSP